MTQESQYPASTQKLLANLGALTNMMRRVAVEAGEITLKYFDMPCGEEAKADGSPVTLADRETEVFIIEKITAITAGIPIVGEESVSLGTADNIKGHDYFWLLDPLDGTKEFISGGGDYTVNIALIHNGTPILGVVYAPVKGELYAGYTEKDGTRKAIRWVEETDTEKEISVRPYPIQGLTVVASKSHGDTNRLDTFLEQFKVEKLVKRGSSLKIAIIAAAKADMYPRFGPTCEWDTAAGDAVLRAAGGFVTDCDGKALTYGGSNEKWLNSEFIASSFEWWGED
ncbi:MAG: 3'(2'),5'-bisphosphate nucleotidase CysQ [Alphaproteobacteria bacterium]